MLPVRSAISCDFGSDGLKVPMPIRSSSDKITRVTLTCSISPWYSFLSRIWQDGHRLPSIRTPSSRSISGRSSSGIRCSGSSCIGQPSIAYTAPASVREYCSRPRFKSVTSVDLPPLTGPINNRIRLRTSSRRAAEWKYSSTSFSTARSSPKISCSKNLYRLRPLMSSTPCDLIMSYTRE
ncbi:hypothetical protein D3C75_704330 [compost metagenome]